MMQSMQLMQLNKEIKVIVVVGVTVYNKNCF